MMLAKFCLLDTLKKARHSGYTVVFNERKTNKGMMGFKPLSLNSVNFDDETPSSKGSGFMLTNHF